jgi:hypothetical protein
VFANRFRRVRNAVLKRVNAFLLSSQRGQFQITLEGLEHARYAYGYAYAAGLSVDSFSPQLTTGRRSTAAPSSARSWCVYLVRIAWHQARDSFSRSPSDKDRTQWRRGMATVAQRKNVVCKVSGIVASAKPRQWTVDDLAPLVNHTLDVFGPLNTSMVSRPRCC